MRFEDGIFIPAALADRSLHYEFVCGWWTRDPLFLFSRSLVAPGDTIFDIGSNIGQWVIGISRRAGPSAVIHAFEPVPTTCERLVHNLALNRVDWVHCHRQALSDENGRATFHVPTNDSATASFAALPSSTRVEVATIRLDRFCEGRGIDRIDLMKVDVEGAELMVFRGAGALLETDSAPVILFEAEEAHCRRLGYSVKAVKRLLADKGYECYLHNGSALVRVSIDDLDHRDLLALKPCHVDRLAEVRRLIRPS